MNLLWVNSFGLLPRDHCKIFYANNLQIDGLRNRIFAGSGTQFACISNDVCENRFRDGSRTGCGLR